LGGARVAAAVGLFEGGVRGVVGCGAGFPSLAKAPDHFFDYLAVCGDADFNLTELTTLIKNLEGSPFSHHLFQFKGKHAWPEEDVMEDIFCWMELKSMQNNLIPVRSDFLSDVKNDFFQRIENLIAGKFIYHAWCLGNSAVFFLEPLTNCDSLKSLVNEIAGSAAFITYQEETKRQTAIESQKKSDYPAYFFSKSTDWWRKELGSIRLSIASTDPDKEPLILMNQRLLAYLSLAAYMQCNALLTAGDSQNALRMIDLYNLIDPENPEPERLKAELKRAKTTK